MEDDSFVEPENENVDDTVNVVDEESVGRDDVIVPEVGMQFNDEKEVYDFYAKYAYAVGFPIRKRSSTKDDDGVLKYVTLTCSREGRRCGNTSTSVKPQPTIQTGCKARISAAFDVHGYWKINTVNLDHNHKTSPTKSRLYRCNRELSAHIKRKLEVNDVAGIPLHKSFNSAVVEAGGYENMSCIEKDCRNYVEKVRRLKLGEGDAAAIQTYFSDMQARYPGFYFSIDLDDDSRLKNVFWADNRCRQAYKEFGDVVTFDTTYLTNKYDMPFAPFVGVNHHGQSTLLGCGLVSNEDTHSFVWLFRTWLQCMHGHAPYGIITDQDRAMQNAIAIVFPNTKHRWCMWHILKKLPEKFGYHVHKSLIFSAIHALVYDTQFVEKFEAGWKLMIDTYDLHENDWLSGLYDNRSRWVPCFLNTTFWAGMSSTQRSESMNAFFDGYVHSRTSLKQFVEQYERALRNKVEKEFQADFKSFSQMVPCATVYQMEKQYQKVYTISKFREVQGEFTGKVYCDLISAVQSPLGMEYEVCEDVVLGERQKKKKFMVTFNPEKCEIICSCHLFEFRGILCRHAIAVLIRNDVCTIPDRYILRRWRRDVSRAHTRVAVNYDGMVTTPGQMRYDDMCKAFSRIADLAADDEVRYRAIMDWIDIQNKELSLTKSYSGSNAILHFTAPQDPVSGIIKNPNSSKKKGAPKTKRIKGPLETKKSKSKSRSDRTKEKIPRSKHTSTDEGVSTRVPQPISMQDSMPEPFSFSQLLLDGMRCVGTQQVPSSSFIPQVSTDVLFTSQDNVIPYSYPYIPDRDASN